MKAIKEIVRDILPWPIVRAVKKYRWKGILVGYKDLSTQQVFTKIYEDGTWGKSGDPAQKFFSGTGSHDALIVTAYIDAVQEFLANFKEKPDVVDLGCGDFFVGSRIRHLCGKYTACDIVEPLIEFNRKKYKDLGVDFKRLDLSKDELPAGDVVFVRQVLQHLSNDQIAGAVPQIASKYKFLVLTEHLPAIDSFVHNRDKPAGPDIRLLIDSGVVITSPPFGLKVKKQTVLCEVPEFGGTIRTCLYEIA